MGAKKSVAPEHAEALVRLAHAVRVRIKPDGTVLGWRGLHIDLDEIEATCAALRLSVRGVDG